MYGFFGCELNSMVKFSLIISPFVPSDHVFHAANVSRLNRSLTNQEVQYLAVRQTDQSDAVFIRYKNTKFRESTRGSYIFMRML